MEVFPLFHHLKTKRMWRHSDKDDIHNKGALEESDLEKEYTEQQSHSTVSKTDVCVILSTAKRCWGQLIHFNKFCDWTEEQHIVRRSRSKNATCDREDR